MSSPFPGMDPYLESRWRDVHTRLVAYTADDLETKLPADLAISLEERIAVESAEDEPRYYVPDLRIVEPPCGEVPFEEIPGFSGVATTYRLLAQVEPLTEKYIKVIEVATARLITVVEFISPTNKTGAGLHDFRAKRAELLAAGASFVEIDLVREGNWQALLSPHRCPRRAIAPYRFAIRMPRDPAAVYLEPIGLREHLPAVSIPLRENETVVRLELQPVVNRVYEKGRYAAKLDYTQPPHPALDGDDAIWAAELLKGRTGR